MYENKDKVIRLRVSDEDIKMLDSIIEYEKSIHRNGYGKSTGLLRFWDNVNNSVIIRSLIKKYYEDVVKKDKK